MKLLIASVALVSSLFTASAFAQAAPAAPAGSTGVCKDGSFTSNSTKRGACSGHKGVKTWYGASAPAAGAAPAGAMAAPAGAMAPAAQKMAPAAASSAPAAGGGPGQVWVNTTSKVYNCAGTKYYGKTKKGSYMTEAAAKAAGAHADHGKACTS
jgi:hypothetical protein